MFEDEKARPSCGPEIFESDPTTIEESWMSFPRYNSMLTDRKRDDDVVEETVDPSVAFAAFSLAKLDTKNSDFTGTVSSLPTTKDVFFRALPSYSEPPAARYARITKELKELQKECGALAKDDKDSGGDIMSKGADNLLATMTSLKGAEEYASILKVDFPLKDDSVVTKGACGVLKKKIGEMEAEKEAKDEEPEMKGVSYEFYGIGQGKSQTIADIVSLDKRLAGIESTVGTTGLSVMPDIRTSLRFLSIKMRGLDHDKIRNAEKKMKGLAREMRNLEKDKNKLPGVRSSEQQQKVAQLYEMMEIWDQSAQQLPIITARLQSIRDMSDVGKGANGYLASVVSDQSVCENLLKENVEVLGNVTKQLSDSLGEFKKITDLEKTFKDFEKKMAKVR